MSTFADASRTFLLARLDALDADLALAADAARPRLAAQAMATGGTVAPVPWADATDPFPVDPLGPAGRYLMGCVTDRAGRRDVYLSYDAYEGTPGPYVWSWRDAPTVDAARARAAETR